MSSHFWLGFLWGVIAAFVGSVGGVIALLAWAPPDREQEEYQEFTRDLYAKAAAKADPNDIADEHY